MKQIIDIRQTVEIDKQLQWVDHTKGAALNTCPMWGMVRYYLNKTPAADKRNLAIEAGSASHDVFAAARYASLFETDDGDFARQQCETFFGPSRFAQLYAAYRTGEQLRERITNFSLEALHTSGYYDDPGDKRRTIQNIEDACRSYLQHYNYEAWTPYVDKEEGFIGIEVPFDITITVGTKRFRFVGKIDAIVNNRHNNEIEIHENKTGSRINDAWAMSFHVSHQVTGYIVASRIIIPRGKGHNINSGVVHGLQIPLPRNVEIGGIVAERVSRTNEQIARWTKWLIDVNEMIDTYKENIYESPQYTHSCNRYFQPCMLIPFCTSDRLEQEALLNDEFRTDEWNPLAKEDA